MKEILIAKEGEICEAYDVRQERDVLVQMVRTLQERERDRGAGGAELKVAAAVQKFKRALPQEGRRRREPSRHARRHPGKDAGREVTRPSRARRAAFRPFVSLSYSENIRRLVADSLARLRASLARPRLTPRCRRS